MQRHYLTFKGGRYHPLTQWFEAVRLGRHQAAAVMAATVLADGSPQTAARIERFVARISFSEGCPPRSGVLSRRNHQLRPSLCNRRVARLGVMGPVPAETGHRFIG
jgi:hypothetical protein